MTVKEYTEEFFRLNIRYGHTEGGIEIVAVARENEKKFHCLVWFLFPWLKFA